MKLFQNKIIIGFLYSALTFSIISGMEKPDQPFTNPLDVQMVSEEPLAQNGLISILRQPGIDILGKLSKEDLNNLRLVCKTTKKIVDAYPRFVKEKMDPIIKHLRQLEKSCPRRFLLTFFTYFSKFKPVFNWLKRAVTGKISKRIIGTAFTTLIIYYAITYFIDSWTKPKLSYCSAAPECSPFNILQRHPLCSDILEKIKELNPNDIAQALKEAVKEIFSTTSECTDFLYHLSKTGLIEHCQGFSQLEFI